MDLDEHCDDSFHIIKKFHENSTDSPESGVLESDWRGSFTIPAATSWLEVGFRWEIPSVEVGGNKCCRFQSPDRRASFSNRALVCGIMRQPGSIVLIRPRGFHYHVFFVFPHPSPWYPCVCGGYFFLYPDAIIKIFISSWMCVISIMNSQSGVIWYIKNKLNKN